VNVVVSQWILVGALFIIALYLLKARQTPSHRAIRRLVILGVLALGFLAVLFPGATNGLAALVGIGRGADLLFYAFIVFALFYVVHQYRRQLWQERTTTELARALTLTQARLADLEQRGSSAPSTKPRSGNSNKRPGG